MRGEDGSQLTPSSPPPSVIFDLRAFQVLAQLSLLVGVDLYAHTTPQGGSLTAAVAYLVPFALQGKPWPYHLTQPFDWGTALPIFRHVAISTGNSSFITWAAALPQDHAADEDSLAWPIPGQ